MQLTLSLSMMFAFYMLTMLPISLFADTANPSKAPKDASASDNPQLQASAMATQSWLKFVDQGKYGESWDEASALMKLTIKKDEWMTLLNQIRKPAGSLVNRQMLDQRVAKNPHGLPKGDYMVMFYKTDFSGKSGAYELVTLFLEDGEWRVLTYQLD
jgi:hypothetical protein